MTELKWEAPDPSRSGPGSTKWPEIIAALKDRPGEWAVVAVKEKAESARSQATFLQTGRVQGVERGEIEAVTRKHDDGTRVYARYVGAV